MKPRQKPQIAARKRPRQTRSSRLVADILEAAVRVLARDGAPDGPRCDKAVMNPVHSRMRNRA